MKEIYADIINLSELEPHHLQSLKARGFSDEVIRKYKFRSCGDKMKAVINDLQLRHTQESLVASKILTANPRFKHEIHINSQLLDDNILIPYMDIDGGIIKIRPHKLGFKDQPPLIYRTESSFKQSDVCVIAESEFKAIASECFGVPAIGIPGIASMSGMHLPYFLDVIHAMNVKEFIICFDNEIKDNPEFANYKPEWKKRYDTILYAFVMCKKIVDRGISCTIATLPDDWMVQGKIDIDTALAQGRTAEDFAAVLNKKQAPDKFLENANINPLHKNYIHRRKRGFFNDSILYISGNCFTMNKEDKEGNKTPVKLLNGHIVVQNTFENDDNLISREFVIIGEYGEVSPPCKIDSSEMSSKKAFDSWLTSHGNYIYYGDDRTLTLIKEYIFDHDESGVVKVIPHIGYIKEHDFWMYSDVLFKSGESFYPDDNGIFWIDGIGYKPGKFSDDLAMPSMSINKESKFDVSRFISLLSDTTDINEPGMAKAMFAWFMSTLFCHVIHKHMQFFPIFFMYGSKGSGKTTVVRWLNSFLGMGGSMQNLMGSTTVGISRTMGYYANLPLVLDDWRDTPEAKKFIPFLLSIYNRQGTVKGVKAQHGIASYPIRSSLAILGEELINDGGLASRCVQFYMPDRRRRECYDEIDTMVDAASSYTFSILTGRYDVMCDNVIKNIKEAKADLSEANDKIESRIIANYAVIKGVWNTLFEPDEELGSYINSKLSQGQSEIKSMDKLVRFFEAMAYAKSIDALPEGMYEAGLNSEITICVFGICMAINKILLQSGKDAIDHVLVTQHFKQQPYYIGNGIIERKFGSRIPGIRLSIKGMSEEMIQHVKIITG